MTDAVFAAEPARLLIAAAAGLQQRGAKKDTR